MFCLFRGFKDALLWDYRGCPCVFLRSFRFRSRFKLFLNALLTTALVQSDPLMASIPTVIIAFPAYRAIGSFFAVFFVCFLIL